MRILYFGNPYSRQAGARSFGYATRFYNGLVRGGHMVHYFADRDEARHKAPLGLFRGIGKKKACKYMFKLLANLKPEALVLSHIG